MKVGRIPFLLKFLSNEWFLASQTLPLCGEKKGENQPTQDKNAKFEKTF